MRAIDTGIDDIEWVAHSSELFGLSGAMAECKLCGNAFGIETIPGIRTSAFRHIFAATAGGSSS
jgi:hypothetical protein